MTWHIHVYFDIEDKTKAAQFWDEIKRNWNVQMGRIHYEPIGPHTKPQFQISLPIEEFDKIVPWLAFSHQEFSVLIHPNTEDEYLDHTDRVIWIGTPVPLDLDKL